MASLAPMERELIVERTRAGLAAARRLGRVGGRKRRMTDSKIKAARRLLAGGTPPRDVAENLGVSAPTLYGWLPASARAQCDLQAADWNPALGALKMKHLNDPRRRDIIARRSAGGSSLWSTNA